jgi:hypothetical protein
VSAAVTRIFERVRTSDRQLRLRIDRTSYTTPFRTYGYSERHYCPVGWSGFAGQRSQRPRVPMNPLTTLFGADSTVVGDRSFRLLLLVNLSPPLGTALVSPLLDSLTTPYAVSEAQVGLVITAFTAPSIVLIPLVGGLSDQIGRKPFMLAGLALFGLGGTALVLTTDFRAVLALRFVQGVGFAGLTPVIVTSIGDLYEASEEATAQGLRFSTSGLALMTFPLLTGVLVAVAWYVPFFLYALPFPVALLLWRYFEEPHETSEAESPGGRQQARRLVGLVQQPRIAAVLVGRSVPNFLYIGTRTTWRIQSWPAPYLPRQCSPLPGGRHTAPRSLRETVVLSDSFSTEPRRGEPPRALRG